MEITDEGNGGSGLRQWKWPVVLAVQLVLMMAMGAAVALLAPMGKTVHGIASWAAAPLLGAVSAYRATRRGLLNYAAWIAPPVCMGVAHLLLWTYLPDPGPVLVCALTSLVGAAAGEVKNMYEKKK